VLYCNCPNEASAARASQLLIDKGFLRARPLAGGLEEWVSRGHRIDVHATSAASARADTISESYGSKYGP